MDKITKSIELANKQIELKYGKWAWSGLYRYVYQSKNFVIKVPRNDHGICCNYNEESLGRIGLKINPHNQIYANCRIVHIFDIPVLFMEKVTIEFQNSNLPDWVKFIDCGQVGWNRKGNLVAYDFG